MSNSDLSLNRGHSHKKCCSFIFSDLNDCCMKCSLVPLICYCNLHSLAQCTKKSCQNFWQLLCTQVAVQGVQAGHEIFIHVTGILRTYLIIWCKHQIKKLEHDVTHVLPLTYKSISAYVNRSNTYLNRIKFSPTNRFLLFTPIKVSNCDVKKKNSEKAAIKGSLYLKSFKRLLIISSRACFSITLILVSFLILCFLLLLWITTQKITI